MPEIKVGAPLRFPRGDCPGMDEYIHPEGYFLRLGAGLPPFAYEQDCLIYEQNKDRATVIEYVTNAGIAVPVIQLIGDGNGRTGGAYLLRPQTYPSTWGSGMGLHNVFMFSPQNPLSDDWYFAREQRGELNLRFKNEVASVLNIAVRKDRIKMMWFLNAREGDGGGARHYVEFPFAWRRNGWYALETILLPTEVTHTWRIYLRLQDLNRPARRVLFVSDASTDPNHALSVTYCGFGDEQQKLNSGLTVLVSNDMDYQVNHAQAETLFQAWQSPEVLLLHT